MKRRQFIKTGIKGGTFLALPFFLGCDDMRVWLRKIRGKIQKPPKVLPMNQREPMTLNFDGNTISVEKALNSRCTSDHDGLQGKFHWGLFDPLKKLDEKSLKMILQELESLPKLDETRSLILLDENRFTYAIDAAQEKKAFERSMIESGFQQQATGMLAAAMGVGYAFKSMGENGKKLEEKTHGAVRIFMEPMLPSYNESHWSSEIPLKEKGWKKGTLPDPSRDGGMLFKKAFQKLSFHHPEGRALKDQKDLGQLLWAAKGRTPHLYLSRPWGRTIPAYMGLQNLSHLSVLTPEKRYDYENWSKNRPTHSMIRSRESLKGIKVILEKHAPYKVFLLLYANETKARSFWEIGHQLFNIVLQAHGLDLDFKVIDKKSMADFDALERKKGELSLVIGLKSEGTIKG